MCNCGKERQAFAKKTNVHSVDLTLLKKGKKKKKKNEKVQESVANEISRWKCTYINMCPKLRVAKAQEGIYVLVSCCF